jgi:hypothetical protein
MKIIRYIGLAIMLISAIIFLLMFTGIIRSSSFDPIDAVFGSFLVGQLFFNVFVTARIELLVSTIKPRRKK